VDAEATPTRKDLLSHGIVEVASPLSWRLLLRRPDARVRLVQFRQPLTDRDYRRLAGWLEDHPSITLRAWGHVPDLEFLRFFPNLQRFSVDTFFDEPESFDGLRHLRPDLHSLMLGSTKHRRSLTPLDHFTGLRRLYLQGHTKDIDVLARLTSLRSLTLREITLPDLSVLLPLTELRALDLKLGGTLDLSLLPRIGRLEYLELWMVRGLADLTPLSDVPTLEYLYLQALRQVTALPDLSRLKRLETVVLETMKGLSDLRPLLTAPALQRVALVDMGHLQPEHVVVLADHPQLRFLRVGLGSDKKNRTVREMVPLPDDWASEGTTADSYSNG
jgi:hypothetical protein